jgi:hypothetical protein
MKLTCFSNPCAVASAAALSIALANGGCQTGEADPAPRSVAESPAVEGLESTRWQGWEAIRLANDEVEVIVVPSIGRVMSFSRVGSGESGNVLWTNPTLFGQPFDGTAEWQNFGGDKLWPWPQNGEKGWEGEYGANWPPPEPFRNVAWSARPTDDGITLFLEAATTGYDFDLQRDIRLQNGSVVITSTLVPAVDDPRSWSAWHVTQIPRPRSTVVILGNRDADLQAASMADDLSLLSDFISPLEPVNGRQAATVVPLEGSYKAGFTSTVLAAGVETDDPVIFLQEVTDMSDGTDLLETDRAQIYVSPADTGELVPWTELEFASPLGENPSLTVRWTLLDAEDVTDPQAVAGQVAEHLSR